MICRRHYVWLTDSNYWIINRCICSRFLVLRTRVHAFIAMLIAASIAGLVGGMSADETLNSITKGFGGTLGSIGIVIGLGVMMGSVLEVSGAAEKWHIVLSKC